MVVKLPITVEIPNFIREVKLSDKQNPIYFIWNGSYIKGKSKTLPISFYKNKFNVTNETKIEELKEGFVIGCIKAGKIISTYRDTDILPKLNELMKQREKGLKYILCRTEGNKFVPVISNTKKVGKPRMYLIKGQDIYSGNLREFTRGIVMDAIKQCYLPFVKPLPVIDNYPIKIEAELYYPIKNPHDKRGGNEGLGQRWDIDNFVYPYLKAFPDLLTSLGKIRDDDRLHLTQSIGVKFIPIQKYENRKLVFIISYDDRPEVIEDVDIMNFHANYTKNSITGESEDNDLSSIPNTPY